MSNGVTDSFKILEGKTIKSVTIQGLNCVLLQTEDGDLFSIETIIDVLGISGMEVIFLGDKG